MEESTVPKVVARSRKVRGEHQFVRPERSRSCSVASSDRSLDLVGDDERDLDVGTEPTAHNLYEGAVDEEGFTTWLDEVPKDIAEVTARKALHKTHAVLLRHVKRSDASGDKTYTLGSLVVHSPLLKNVLRRVLNNYPGAGVHSKEPTFKPPFAPFFHRWDEFEQALEASKDDEVLHAHLKLLHSILDAELSPIRHEARSLIKHGVITYDLLWTLFPPGSTVFGKLYNQEHAFTVRSVHQKALGTNLKLESIDYDGIDFGFAEQQFILNDYVGEKNIHELDIVPKIYHPDRDALLEHLYQRGKKFVDVMNAGYRSYVGFCFPLGIDTGNGEFVDGRIMVDAAGYRVYNPQPPLRALTSPFDRGDDLPVFDPFDYAYPMPNPVPVMEVQPFDYPLPPQVAPSKKSKKGGRSSSFDPYIYPRLPNQSGQNIHRPLPTNKVPASTLTSDQIRMCSSVVKGFCLTTKHWAKFQVDDVAEIGFNNDAFAKLVMSSNRKRLIRALVKEQAGQRTQFDDIIQGKGLGLIMLLSGPPGTGKTLTAESISDALQLPLYVLTAPELLDDIDTIETRLQSVFQLAAQWDAVVLLDEADAFLEKRTNEVSQENRERNKRVAAFLRLLEYFKGTLILTTNRPITFDEAFYSRIHLTLRFQPLDVHARRSIWNNFLTTDEYRPSPRELDVLARIDLNGREIKNVVKMAKLLANSQDESIDFTHVNDVLDVIETPNEEEVREAL